MVGKTMSGSSLMFSEIKNFRETLIKENSGLTNIYDAYRNV